MEALESKDDFDKNNRNWDERVGLHVSSSEYNLKGFKDGKNIMEKHVVKELGDVAGKTMLHLMCHFGMDTLCWARDYGAIVTGVDFSNSGIQVAQSLAKELKIQNVTFIVSNIYELNNNFPQQEFDFIVMTHGILCWLPDLPQLMKQVVQYLKKGGKFYLCDDHPVTNLFEDALTVEGSYFHKRIELVCEKSYVLSDGSLKNSNHVEWTHSLADILNAILGAQLQLLWVHEHPFSFWNRFPNMKEDETGFWLKGEHENSVPLVFSLMATK